MVEPLWVYVLQVIVIFLTGVLFGAGLIIFMKGK